MELMDQFGKLDTAMEASVKRSEQVYVSAAQELNQQAELIIEKQQRGGKKETQSIEEYIKYFKWDTSKFPVDKSLKVIGAKIMATQKTCDDKLKKQLEE
jgi:hypothetical protein